MEEGEIICIKAIRRAANIIVVMVWRAEGLRSTYEKVAF